MHGSSGKTTVRYQLGWRPGHEEGWGPIKGPTYHTYREIRGNVTVGEKPEAFPILLLLAIDYPTLRKSASKSRRKYNYSWGFKRNEGRRTKIKTCPRVPKEPGRRDQGAKARPTAAPRRPRPRRGGRPEQALWRQQPRTGVRLHQQAAPKPSRAAPKPSWLP